jgi:hypothetical protein
VEFKPSSLAFEPLELGTFDTAPVAGCALGERGLALWLPGVFWLAVTGALEWVSEPWVPLACSSFAALSQPFSNRNPRYHLRMAQL